MRHFFSVSAKGLNLRSGPGTGHKILRVLPRGAAVELLELDDDWFRVRTVDQVDGYVAGMYLEPHPAPWYAVAQMELRRGVREVIGRGDNARILTYHSSTALHATSDDVPWCSAFACWCAEQVRVRSPRSAAARDWLKWGRSIETPSEGCIAIFSRTGNPKHGHVAFFVRREGEQLVVLGGNQGNQISESRYPAVRLLGYRLPAG